MEWAHCHSLKIDEENGVRMEKKKWKTKDLEKTMQRNRGRKEDKRRGYSFVGVAPSWAHNSFGKGFLVTWQKAAEQRRSWRLFLKYILMVPEYYQRTSFLLVLNNAGSPRVWQGGHPFLKCFILLKVTSNTTLKRMMQVKVVSASPKGCSREKSKRCCFLWRQGSAPFQK